MMTDPIADMLTRLRNASLAKLDRAEIPLSKLKLEIAKILKAEGYVSDYEVGDKAVTVFLKYGRDRRGAIVGIRRASRPGRRYYVNRGQIPTVHNGLGIAILSTSSGVMTDRDARAKGVGGEVLCEVW
ncbi:MAG: 30S ribosomal protein S8 [Myxococcales bacterium]|nr:30S ribosomal protein S8 [Myxococcales bacterium]